MSLQIRTLDTLVQIREDGRTLDVLAVPYDAPTRVGGYVETFIRGAFPGALERPQDVKLLAGHDHHGLPLGRATAMEDTAAGLRATFVVSQTRAGDEALTLVRDGALSAVSVGFVPDRDRWNPARTAVTRARAHLLEVSLVAVGAYPAAKVLAVRRLDRTPTPGLSLARRR